MAKPREPGAAPAAGKAAGTAPAAGDDALAAELAAIESGRLDAGPGDAGHLVRHLVHPRKPLRRLAAGALGAAIRRGSIPAEICEKLLASDDASQRWGAAFALSRAARASAAVVEVAIEMLASDDGDLRWAAASIVIAAARESEGLRERLRSLAVAGSPTLRKMALLCLADSGAHEQPVFEAALADAEPLVRIAALTAIGRSGLASDATRSRLRSMAENDPAAPVRRAATAILHRLETKSEEK